MSSESNTATSIEEGKDPIHILYMEDDPALARLLQRKLERAGYVVDIASDGQEGLTMYQNGNYDLVTVDQNMPGHDGLDVIRILNSQGYLPPTIMITGSGNEKTAVEAMKLGAGDYIVKDIEGGYLELLPSVVQQVLRQRRLAEEKQEAVEALKQRNRDLALLNQTGQILTATLDLQQVIDQLLQTIIEVIKGEGVSVWLWDKEREGWLHCQAVLHHGLERSMVDLRLCPGQGIAGWVAERGQSIIVPDAPSDPRYTPNIDAQTGYHTTSLLAVPLRVRDSVIGVLEVVDKKEGDFDNHDLTLAETLAASAGIAINNAQLIETLRQRTVELQTRNEELDAFAHTVAHDLKTPLSTIIGYADIMVGEYTDTINADGVEYLQTITQSGRKMSSIIEELLVLTAVRKRDVQPETLDMANVVAEAQQRLAYMFEKHQIELILPEAWPAALGYGPWVEEVWVNYISNAVKYGGKPPRVELGATRRSNGEVSFWVRDNGPGLTPEEQKLLFTPFTQLSQVRVEGHGLGLSIVRRIVERLGGQVGVESEKKEGGSTFWFTLPT